MTMTKGARIESKRSGNRGTIQSVAGAAAVVKWDMGGTPTTVENADRRLRLLNPPNRY